MANRQTFFGEISIGWSVNGPKSQAWKQVGGHTLFIECMHAWLGLKTVQDTWCWCRNLERLEWWRGLIFRLPVVGDFNSQGTCLMLVVIILSGWYSFNAMSFGHLFFPMTNCTHFYSISVFEN